MRRQHSRRVRHSPARRGPQVGCLAGAGLPPRTAPRGAARRDYSPAAAPPGGDWQGSWGRCPEFVSLGHNHHLPLPFREVLALALGAAFSNQTRDRLCGALLQVPTVSTDFWRWRAWHHRRPTAWRPLRPQGGAKLSLGGWG